ncbi:MAG: hypothetical protein EXR72_06220 [Myxococcales bacterium]|nr:hypothetical protein [Myxococcales bacterium]
MRGAGIPRPPLAGQESVREFACRLRGEQGAAWAFLDHLLGTQEGVWAFVDRVIEAQQADFRPPRLRIESDLAPRLKSQGASPPVPDLCYSFAGMKGHLLRALIVVMTLVVLGEFLALGMRVRLAIAADWHAPAGDGVQYHDLANNWMKTRRFGFGTTKNSYARPPLYPLFLAHVVDLKPLPMQEHLVRATRWNAYLDGLTALLVFAIAWRLGLRAAGWLALIGVLACPVLTLIQCYALTESLATMLTTATLLFTVLALDGKVLRFAIAAGFTGGLIMLTRLDGITIVPPVLFGIALATASRKRRLAGMALFVATFALTFSPWAYRNYKFFGTTHIFGVKWIAKSGKPMLTGPEEWMWTWERHGSGGLINLRMLSRSRLELSLMPPDVLRTDEERGAVARAFQRCNAVGVTDAVAREFGDLARKRKRDYPFESYVAVPLGRVLDLFADTIQEGDFPMKVGPFGLGDRRTFTRWNHRLYLLAAAGLALALLLARRYRRVALIIVAATATRALVDGYVQAHVTQRYIVEIFPLLILLAAMAPELAVRRLWATWRALILQERDRGA